MASLQLITMPCFPYLICCFSWGYFAGNCHIKNTWHNFLYHFIIFSVTSKNNHSL